MARIGKKFRFDHVQLWTISKNEIDDVKFAVASMLGALFLSQLRQKVHRGTCSAVLAGPSQADARMATAKSTGLIIAADR